MTLFIIFKNKKLIISEFTNIKVSPAIIKKKQRNVNIWVLKSVSF